MISTEWYHGCSTQEERDTRKGLAESSSPILEVLITLLERRKKALDTKGNDYDVAAWAFLQAHRNGQQEELDRLINLLRSATDHE